MIRVVNRLRLSNGRCPIFHQSALALHWPTPRSVLWIERLQADRTALVCKVPETAIKAALQGASISLLIGEVQTPSVRLLCLGITIRDESERPLTVQRPTTDPEEIALLADVLSSGSTTLHFVNELDHPVLSGWCQFEHAGAATAVRGFASCDPWILTPESSQQMSTHALALALESAMDRFPAAHFQGSDRAGLARGHVLGPNPIDFELVENDSDGCGHLHHRERPIRD